MVYGDRWSELAIIGALGVSNTLVQSSVSVQKPYLKNSRKYSKYESARQSEEGGEAQA